MRFENARISGNEEVVSLNELTNSKNLSELRENLLCPISGCTAQLSYISAKKPYLKTKNKSVHSDDCPYRNEEEYKIYLRKNESKRRVTLNEAQVQGRLDRMIDYVYPNRKKKAKEKSENSVNNKKGKKYVATGTKEKAVAGLENSDSSTTTEKAKGIRVPAKRLNEFYHMDEGELFKIPAIIKSIVKKSDKNYTFYIKGIDNDAGGKVVLKDPFFSRNIQGINEMLDFLKESVENDQGEIRIAFLGVLTDSANLTFELVRDFDFKLFKSNRKYTLAEFVNYQSRNNS